MNEKYLKNRILAIILSITFILPLILQSPGVSLATGSEDELEEVNQQQQEAMDEMAELEVLVLAQMEEVDRLYSLVDEKQKDLDAKQAEVDILIKEITEQRNSIDDRKGNLGERLRSMYKKGSVGMLDVLLKSNSFSEFLSNLSMLQIIYQHDQDTLESLEDQYQVLKGDMADLGKAKAELEVNQKALQAELDNAEYAEAVLEESLAQVRIKVEELEAEKAELEAIIAEEQRQAAEAAAASGYVVAGGSGYYIWPASGPITYGYGYRYDPVIAAVGGSTFHEGIDIGVDYGSPVYASAAGTVSGATGWSGGYGNLVAINHDNGTTTFYGHNSQILVSSGQYVEQGQLIAYAGSTGNSTGPHVHFEIIIGGSRVDPMEYL